MDTALVYKFTRKDYSNQGFPGTNLIYDGQVKFDVFENEKHVGILITSQQRAWGEFLNEEQLTTNSNKWTLPPKKSEIFTGQNLFATINVKRRFFRNEIVTMKFNSGDWVYTLSHLERHLVKLNTHGIYRNSELIGTIKSLKTKGLKLFSTYSSDELNGSIELKENFAGNEVLCFLQLFQVHMQLEDANVG